MGDRVLISPDEENERTSVGLYLPQTVLDKETVQSGRIVATGPGISIPYPPEGDDEPWKATRREPQYIPMEAKEGDYAIFLRKAAVEIKIEEKTYLVVPQSAILVLFREEIE